MVSITISVDTQSKHDMEQFAWVNWSEVAREIFLKKLKEYEELQRINTLLKKSKLTEKDIIELSKKSRKGRFKQLKSQGLI
jgi:hypothetical protein